MRVVLMALALAIAEPAFAQIETASPAAEPTQAQYQATIAWASKFQAIMAVTSALQDLPRAPPSFTPETKRQWVAQSRAWIASYRQALASAQAQAAALGPVPPSPQAPVYQSEADLLPPLLENLNQFVGHFSDGVDAIERGDVSAARQITGTLYDAAILLARTLGATNRAGAAAIPAEHPQHFLVQSFADSSDAMIAAFEFKKAELGGDQSSRAATADALSAVATRMRADSGAGRVAAGAQVQRFQAAAAPPEQRDFQQRLIAAFNTYAGSFDREETMARDFERAAALLHADRPFDQVKADFDAAILDASTLDGQRGADIRQRLALVQGM